MPQMPSPNSEETRMTPESSRSFTNSAGPRKNECPDYYPIYQHVVHGPAKGEYVEWRIHCIRHLENNEPHPGQHEDSAGRKW